MISSKGGTAIHVDKSSSVILKNVTIKDSDTGIRSDGGSVQSENVHFDNVRMPYDVSGGASARVRGSRITNDPKPRQNNPPTHSATGWRRPKGPPLPAFCSSCKSIFPSRNYVFGGAYFHSWDNEETCPKCGSEHAKLSEGIFDLTAETVRILSAPDFTYALVAALQKALEAVISGAQTVDNAARALDAISSDAGRLLRKARKYGVSGILFISAVVSAIYAKGSYDVSVQQLQISQEQLRIEKEENGSFDKKLDQVLEQLRNKRFSPEHSGARKAEKKHRRKP